MGISKKQKITAAFCAAAYLALPALVFWAYSIGRSVYLCVAAAAYINGVTSFYYYSFMGKKSTIFVAALGLIFNLVIFIFSLNGLFMNQSGRLSDEESVLTILFIGCGIIYLISSIKKVRENHNMSCDKVRM